MSERYTKFVAGKLQKSGFTDVQIIPEEDEEFGADLLAVSKSGAKVCIKCCYSSQPVNASAVQTILAAKQYYKCNAAMIVTNSTFTEKAKAYAAEKRVSLKESIALPQVETNDKIKLPDSYSLSNAANNTKTKKPIYKTVWFWLIVAFIIFWSIGKLNGGTDVDDQQPGTVSENTVNANAPAELSRSEYIAQCAEIPYTDIARTPDNFKGKSVKINGTVIQVSEGLFDSVTLRIQCGGEDIWYVTYTRQNADEERILEGDWITAYGECNGVESYTAIFGNTITIPSMSMKYFDTDNGIPEPDTEITYTAYTVAELITDYDTNALNAKEKYFGEYVELTGHLGDIDSNGKYVVVYPGIEQYEYDGVRCYIKTEEQTSVIRGLATDSSVTVKGRIINVSDYPGYELDIVEIK